MGGECGLIDEIRPTPVPIDAPVPRSRPTPITLGTNAEGRPPDLLRISGRFCCVAPSWAKKGQGSQGTESPVGCAGNRMQPGLWRCRLCLIACNTRQFDEVSPFCHRDRGAFPIGFRGFGFR